MKPHAVEKVHRVGVAAVEVASAEDKLVSEVWLKKSASEPGEQRMVVDASGGNDYLDFSTIRVSKHKKTPCFIVYEKR